MTYITNCINESYRRQQIISLSVQSSKQPIILNTLSLELMSSLLSKPTTQIKSTMLFIPFTSMTIPIIILLLIFIHPRSLRPLLPRLRLAGASLLDPVPLVATAGDLGDHVVDAERVGGGEGGVLFKLDGAVATLLRGKKLS